MPLHPEILTSLRDYQKDALKFMVQRKAALEYDDMGLGKTLITLAAVDQLDGYPCLIVGPKFALSVWESEIAKWLDMPATIYSGKPKDREKQWKQFITRGDKFLITNYALLPEMASRSGIMVEDLRTALQNTPGTFYWQAIIWDEAHMGGLFNYKNDTFKISAKLARDIPKRFVLTGTPFRQGVVDLFGPLHLIAPNKFDSYWKYVNKYCTIIKDSFGKHIERNPANIGAFRMMLHQYMVRRTKEQVLSELPGKNRQSLYVEMNAEQRKVYDELTEELIAEVPNTGDIIVTPNQMSLIMRQRQILACPQVLGLKYRGAAIDAIIEHSHLSLDENKPIVIFTPFKKAVPIIMEAIKEEYGVMAQIYCITGGLTAEQFGEQWMNFQKTTYGCKVLICVIKSGASFQATVASTAYFLGYEWDFNMNEQAEDRLNRMGQKNFVNIYYLMHKGTVDEQVAQRLNEKKSASDWVVGSDAQYVKQLRKLYGNAKQINGQK
jgi:SNF2 family DNA or RNA helicase